MSQKRKQTKFKRRKTRVSKKSPNKEDKSTSPRQRTRRRNRNLRTTIQKSDNESEEIDQEMMEKKYGPNAEIPNASPSSNDNISDEVSDVNDNSDVKDNNGNNNDSEVRWCAYSFKDIDKLLKKKKIKLILV